MADQYASFGPFVLFKEVATDVFGHLYRAGEVDRSGWRRTVWLRVFDAPALSPEPIIERRPVANKVGQNLEATNAVEHAELHVVDGVPALAWKHVPAHPLSMLLSKVRDEGFPIAADNSLLIMEKIALALSAGLAFEVDGQSLVHGLLCPDLIQITDEGETLVSAFAVADTLMEVLDDPDSRDRVGSYMAPELLESRTPSKRTDVYSLGAILFELLTGHPLPADPQARADAIESAEMFLDHTPVPDDIGVLLKRSLAERPEDRFSSAADFKKELDKLLYGGNYSPTTFNLALFMDRLFREEIDTAKREELTEAEVDPTPYILPEEDEEEEIRRRSRAGLWLAIAAALVVVAAAIVVVGPRLMGPGPTPTPTPEELEAREAARQERMDALVKEEVERLMAERQAEAQEEIETREEQIASLRRQLDQVQQASAGSEEQRRAEQLREELEAAEAEKAEREAQLEAERQRLEEEARQTVREQEAAEQIPTPEAEETPVPTGEAETEAPAAAATEEAETVEETPAAAPTPTPVPSPVTRPTAPAVEVTEGMFIEATEVDSRPVQLRTDRPRWPRMARRSRARGVIILEAQVDHTGNVTEVKVLRADHDRLGIPEAAKEAVERYVFKPATKNGVRVATKTTVTIPYHFQGR